MAAEQDHQILTTVADWLWAVVIAAVGALTRWIYGHEQRVTRLEAQREESERVREEVQEALSEIRHEQRTASSKLDRILGRLGGRDDGGQ